MNPLNERDDWTSYLDNIMVNFGLDPLYTWVIIANLITVIFWKDFKNWRKKTASVRFYDVSFVFGLGVMNLFCLLRLIGVFDF